MWLSLALAIYRVDSRTLSSYGYQAASHSFHFMLPNHSAECWLVMQIWRLWKAILIQQCHNPFTCYHTSWFLSWNCIDLGLFLTLDDIEAQGRTWTNGHKIREQMSKHGAVLASITEWICGKITLDLDFCCQFFNAKRRDATLNTRISALGNGLTWISAAVFVSICFTWYNSCVLRN